MSDAPRFDANAAQNSRQVIEIWEPTFRMKPREEERFVPRQVEMIIRDIMDKKLKKAKFDDQKCKVGKEGRWRMCVCVSRLPSLLVVAIFVRLTPLSRCVRRLLLQVLALELCTEIKEKVKGE